MATVAEVQKAIDALKKTIAELNKATTDRSGIYKAGGRTFRNVEELKAAISAEQKKLSTLNKSLTGYRKLETAYNNAEAAFRRAQENVNDPIGGVRTGKSKATLQSELAEATRVRNSAKAAFDTESKKAIGVDVRSLAPSRPPSSSISRIQEAEGRTSGLVGSRTGTNTGLSNDVSRETPASPTSPSAPTRSRTGGTGTSGTTATKKAAATKAAADKKAAQQKTEWERIIREEFGSLWDIYNDNADVKAVIDKAVKEGWYNDAAKLQSSLANTGWFRRTEQSARQWAILKSADPATAEDNINQGVAQIRDASLSSGLTLDDQTLRKLAEDNIKFGWSAIELRNAVGSEAVATARLGGAQGVSDLRRGLVGTTLQQIAANYAQKPSSTLLDSWVAEIMTGTKSEQQFIDLMKEQARTQYRSLQSQIDRGIDVQTATSAFRQQAVQTLGMEESAFDLTQDKWNRALNYQDPKTNEYRQMDMWEWNRYLRSLPEWQQTDDAKQTYRTAAFTLAQAFGRTT